MKFCPKCPEGSQWHHDKEFGRNKGSKDGLAAYCKACTSRYHKEWRATHGKNVREYNRQATVQRRFDSGRKADEFANQTGYKGIAVYRHLSTRDWPGALFERYQARIIVDGKRRSLGYFDTPEDAALAYDQEVDRLNLGREKNFS